MVKARRTGRPVSMRTTRAAIVALASAALLGLTACGGSTNPDEPVGPADTHTERSDDTSSSQTSQETSSSSSSDTSSAPTSSAASPTGDPVLAAITAAEDEADGTFDDAELEEENGTHHWKISVDVNGNDTDVLVDVTTGKATPESDDDGADDDADDN